MSFIVHALRRIAARLRGRPAWSIQADNAAEAARNHRIKERALRD